MFAVALLLKLLPVPVDVGKGHLLGFYEAQVEVHVDLCDSLIEPTTLVQTDELDRVAALVASVAIPAGLVDLQGRGLLAVEGAADVSAAVGSEAVVLHDLLCRDRALDDRGGFHDGHRKFTPLLIVLYAMPISSAG